MVNFQRLGNTSCFQGLEVERYVCVGVRVEGRG